MVAVAVARRPSGRLDYAAAAGQVDAIKLRLAHGARVDRKHAEGLVARDYAQSDTARQAQSATPTRH